MREQVQSKYKFVVKSPEVMKDYICLHWLVPKYEMRDFHHKIPTGEIWVRRDIWEHPFKHGRLKVHENTELKYMLKYGEPYQKAHKKAEIADGLW